MGNLFNKKNKDIDQTDFKESVESVESVEYKKLTEDSYSTDTLSCCLLYICPQNAYSCNFPECNDCCDSCNSLGCNCCDSCPCPV